MVWRLFTQVNQFLDRWSPQILSIARIVIAFLFMAHGTQTLFGYPIRGDFAGVDLFSWMGVTGILETFGGLAILLGIFTRSVALILAVEMAVVYVTTYAPNGIWPRLNGGDLSVFYCFFFLYLAAAGGGPWSLDARWRGQKQVSPGYLTAWEPQLRSVLRIVVTFLFFTHGTEDVLGWPWPEEEGPFPGPDLSGLSGTGHLMEVIGGPILLVGLFSKPLAFIFSGEMAVAYFNNHQPRAFWPILNGGEDCIFFSFTFLYLAAVGGGPWALDQLFGWGGKRQRAADSGRRSQQPISHVSD